MLQKIIQVGNSLAVVLPKPFVQKARFKAGEEVQVETNETIRAVYIRPKSAKGDPALTPEFKAWLDEVVEKERDIIAALAKA